MRVISLLTLIAVAGLSPSATAKERRIYRAYVVLAGAHSQIDTAEYHRVTSQKDLADLWLRHTGQGRKGGRERAEVPVVDFKRCLVIAVFGGRTTNCEGIYPHFMADGLTATVYVRYVARSYQTGREVDRVTPFGFFVVERWKNAVVLKQGFFPLGGGAPRWERRAAFSALEG